MARQPPRPLPRPEEPATTVSHVVVGEARQPLERVSECVLVPSTVEAQGLCQVFHGPGIGVALPQEVLPGDLGSAHVQGGGELSAPDVPIHGADQ